MLLSKDWQSKGIYHQASLDLALITKTWLQSHIQDNIVSISGYNFVHLDRHYDTHGGICIYIKNSISFQVLTKSLK